MTKIHQVNVRMDDDDLERVRQLERVFRRKQSAVIRYAVRLLFAESQDADPFKLHEIVSRVDGS